MAAALLRMNLIRRSAWARVVVCSAAVVLAGCSNPASSLSLGASQDRQEAASASSASPTAVRPEQAEEDRASTDDAAIAQTLSIASWIYADAPGQIITTPNYELYTTLTDRSRGRRRLMAVLPHFLESAIKHYRTALIELPEPPNRLRTYLFDNAEHWRAKTVELLPQQAASFTGLGRGGYATRGMAVMWYIGTSDTLAIAAHEGWHQYTQATFESRLPVWLEEGVATYMEGFITGHDGTLTFKPRDNSERWWALHKAWRRDRLIPLTELLDTTPQDFLAESKDRLLVYYAQVWALTRFLAEGEDGRYREALGQVLTDAASGDLPDRLLRSDAITTQYRRRIAASSNTGPWVILEYFNRDLAEFEEQYLAYVKDLVTPRRDRGRRGRRR